MATKVFDRHGDPAPTITVTGIRRHAGKFWKLVDRRGAVGISLGGETIAVALSLDQFIALLFGIQARPRRKKRKSLGKARRKR